jgi:putative tricarboxylic transport membrane protein
MHLSVILDILMSPAILMVSLGTIFGIIIGSIPGLGAGIGVTVLLPFTYAMDPVSALLLLAGVFMGCGYGASISGILLNIPGNNEALCTTIEGYPLMRKGRGKEALYLSALSSAFGGFFGILLLIFFAPNLARIALKFGPPEMTLTTMLGLIIIAALSADNLLKGIFGACFGMLVNMVGIDTVSGVERFTFGFPKLTMGVKMISLALGIIAGREMIIQIQKLLKNGRVQHSSGDHEQLSEGFRLENISPFTVLKNIFRKPGTIIKSSTIGTIIGILPGAGAAIAAYVAYGEAKRKAKEPFGEGNPEGIIASESSCAAAVGGTFVPMMALGIPGSPTCALIFGALTLHGIAVGPNLFTEYAKMSYGFMYGMVISVVVMALASLLFTPTFSKIIKVKMEYIIPVVVCCMVLGAFSIRNNMYDVFTVLVFSVIGLLFVKIKVPPAPVFLGFILGPLIENNLLLSLTISKAVKQNFFQYAVCRPVCIIIFVIGMFLLWANVKSIQSQNKTKKAIAGN